MTHSNSSCRGLIFFKLRMCAGHHNGHVHCNEIHLYFLHAFHVRWLISENIGAVTRTDKVDTHGFFSGKHVTRNCMFKRGNTGIPGRADTFLLTPQNDGMCAVVKIKKYYYYQSIIRTAKHKPRIKSLKQNTQVIWADVVYSSYCAACFMQY